MLYFAYLDEFGHIGPYISRHDPKHNTSPVFGLGGIVLPYTHARFFSMFFYKLKEELLKEEISVKRKVHPAKWEKKGAALYTVNNITKYRELRAATNRILSRLKSMGGFVFYTGIEKLPPDEKRIPERLYLSVLVDAIRKLNNFCRTHTENTMFTLILDAVDSDHTKQRANFRPKSVEAASKSMFGTDKCFHLVEPPFQVESHLYQNMQCADWLCGLLGRLLVCQCSTEFPEFEVFEKYFKDRISAVTTNSSLRRRKCCRVLHLPGI
jgi:hypothetical protein